MSETPVKSSREGSLAPPKRHPIRWQDDSFWDEAALEKELERVFDLCHGCRRCVSLCNAFPTLFDLVDASQTMEVDGVAKSDYRKVVDECYLCDLCFATKCPYVPPHEWDLDFPHLMLRAKAVHFRTGGAKLRDRLLTSTDFIGKTLARPVVAGAANAANANATLRRLLDKTFEIHADAWVPPMASRTLRSRLADHIGARPGEGVAAGPTRGRVALFATCYCNYNEPDIGQDLVAVLEHNGIEVVLANKETCCGMPKLELGDLDAVRRAKEINIPELARLVDAGYDLTAAIPSCVLMFRQELPLMFPDDPDVAKVKAAFYDPFEYLMLRHRHGALKTDFKTPLGSVSYQAACHQRVQNMGRKTLEALQLVPGTTVKIIERCAGHDGTYALKSEKHKTAMKIVKPVAGRVTQDKAEHFGSDCPMGGHHIETALGGRQKAEHPISLLRKAYGI